MLVVSSATCAKAHADRRSDLSSFEVNRSCFDSDILPENILNNLYKSLNGTSKKFIAAVKAFNFYLHLRTHPGGL